MCTVHVAGVFYLSLDLRMRSFERLAAHSIVNPRATQGLPEPKPSISAGQIPHMQTNELAHSPPAGARGDKQQKKQGAAMLGEVTGPHIIKWRLGKPSCDAGVKGQANIRINRE